MATQEEKIAKIQGILKYEYNNTRWKRFLSELFTSSNFFSSPTTLPGIHSSVASQALQIGSITINENGISRNIAVYEVTLADNVVLERNRVGLRNLLKPHWKEQDAAFIVYHHPQDKSWRFSYVSELKTFNEAGEYVDNKTEPKRYTYVLGENESCRTAAIQFSKLQDKASNATLDDIKEAFSVEKMSKEFFDTYKDHYQDFVQYLTGKRLEKVSGKWEEVVKHAPNTQLITIFNNNEKDVRDFCKKLLGRIVFLYFIQKKGWLGVPLHDKWGNGKPDFISRLLANCRNPSIFYSEYLSKLFFETLNQPRPDDLAEIIPGEKTRVPYLNGGLFEEDDPNQRGLIFEADLFKKLFAFFDQYNFTIYEDDPNDHTVAVDPEMLGHIFENLLEDNKDKGAFYTPKEIVHYMCQESLIEYLTTWFEGKNYQVKQDTFISFDNAQQASFLSANEGNTGQGILEIAQPTQSSSKVINRSLIEKLLKKQLSDDDKQAVKQHAAEFNEALDKVKICDPAIGSGAFPMGLLLEIFTAKQTIHSFTHGDLTTFEPATVKLNIIQNSIYGVDIERGAVDIARLRFWLSLVVDEPEPQPLPNLDYKIVVGNSLISKLGDDVIEIDWDIKKNTTFDIFGEQETKSIQNILKQLTQLQKEFFDPSTRKKDHSTKIRDLKIDLLNEQLSLMIQSKGVATKPVGNGKAITAQTERYLQTEGWKQQIRNLQLLKSQQDKTLEFFDWQLNFAEVMNRDVAGNVGFDILIGNPPYINVENLDPITKKHLFESYQNIQGRADIYVGFIERCVSALKSKGVLSFIIPYAFTNQNYAEAMRNHLVNNTFINKIVDLTNFMVFDSATVKNIILSIQHDISSDKNTQILKLNSINDFETNNFKSSFLNQRNFLLLNKCRLETKEIFHLLPLKNKIDNASIKFESIYLVAYGARLNNKINGSKKETYVSDTPQAGYKPFIEGKDINRYRHKQTGWLNYQPREHYNPMFSELFENVKIMFINVVSDQLRFTIDFDGLYNSHTVINCVRADLLVNATHTTANSCIQNTDLNLARMYDHKFVLSLLNSNLINWYFRNFQSEGLHFYPDDAKKLPMIRLDHYRVNQLLFINIVDQILANKIENKPTDQLERQLDNLVYKLYNLSYNEVKLIEQDFVLSEAEYNAIVI